MNLKITTQEGLLIEAMINDVLKLEPIKPITSALTCLGNKVKTEQVNEIISQGKLLGL